MAERFVAILQWMGGEKGYGFLVNENGVEKFVHYIPIAGEGFRILSEGDKCGFAIEEGPRGLFAVNIYQPDGPAPRIRENRDR